MKLKLIIALLLISAYIQVNAQYFCPVGSPWGSACVGINTNDVILSNCNWAGEYATATGLISGLEYNINTCGGSWDTYIEVRDASTLNMLGFNDDGCGLQSSVNFMAPASGSVLICIREYHYGKSCNYCGSYGCQFGAPDDCGGGCFIFWGSEARSCNWTCNWTNTSCITTRIHLASPYTPTILTNIFHGCSQVDLQRGIPPANLTFYWQTSPSGTDMANSSLTWTVYNAGTYYLRARDNCGNWSDASSVSVTIGTPPAPPNPVTGGTYCGSPVTLSAPGSPPSNTSWFWQTTSNDTSTVNSGPSYNITAIGTTTTYLRARDNFLCWSNGVGSATVTILPLPADPPAPIGGVFCGGPVTASMNGSPPPGYTWYWETSPTGTNTSNSNSTLVISDTGTTFIYVRARNNNTGCWSPNAGVSWVTINPNPTPLTISGLTAVCSGTQNVTYSLPAVPGNTYIPWSVTCGGSGSGTIWPSSSLTAEVNWGTVTSNSVCTIHVRQTNQYGCFVDLQLPVSITILPTTPSPVTAVPSTICNGQSTNLIAVSNPGATIRWYNAINNLIGTSVSGQNFRVYPTTTSTYYAETYIGGTCGASPRTAVTVNVSGNPLPTTAHAGSDLTGNSMCGLTSVMMNGNTAFVGTGQWSVISGTGGSFNNSNNPNTPFSGSAGSEYLLTWTISNSPCISSIDTVIVKFLNNPTGASAGTDQNGAALCDINYTTMQANTPVYGTGNWSIVSGTGGSFSNPSNPSSNFSGVSGTQYVLRWTIANPPCDSSFDDVLISFPISPSPADAGIDVSGISTCGLSSVSLSANTPAIGTGSWSIVSGNGGLISDIYNPGTLFSGVPGVSYTLRWTVNNPPCQPSFDDVLVRFEQNPTPANAGSDQTGANLCGQSTTNLNANIPSIGSGQWSIINGLGSTIANPGSPSTSFTGLQGTDYVLRWTISNLPCFDSFDDITVSLSSFPTPANAGPDLTGISMCGLDSIMLGGNRPVFGDGSWTILNGTGGTFSNDSDANSIFYGIPEVDYSLRWTISNPPCGSTSDDVIVRFEVPSSIANAGNDMTGNTLCGMTSVSLSANTPVYGIGTWSIYSGTGGAFTDIHDPTTTFTAVPGNAYTLLWSINNSPCRITVDTVLLTFPISPTVANAGPDQTGANMCAITSTQLQANSPLAGSGYWTIMNGAGGVISDTVNPTATFTGAAGINYTLRWTIINPPCNVSYNDVNIIFHEMPTGSVTPLTSFICNGSGVTLTANGTGSFLWNTGDTTSSLTLNNLSSGTIYSVSVTLGLCQIVLQSSVFVNPQMFLNIDSLAVSCFAGNNGTASVSVTGGAFPYFYLWSDGQTTNPAINLTTGTYSVTVTEGSTLHCTVSGNIAVPQPSAPISIIIDSVNNVCFGRNEGWINSSVNGGTPPYTFLWNNGRTTDSISNLTAGRYTVTVTDFNHCTLIRNIDITQPSRLTITIDSSNVTCNGLNNGWISAIVNGGTLQYTYLWNIGNITPNLTNLSPGLYSVTVTDLNSCISVRPVNITEPDLLTVQIDSGNVNCYNAMNGWANAIVAGGTLPYSYTWSNGWNTALNENLGPGNYSVHISDAHNCSTDGDVSISQPDELTLSENYSDVLCHGENTAWIHVTVLGGIPPYQYNWSNGQTNDSIAALTSGNYTLTVTDNNFCLLIRSFDITEPDPLSISITAVDERCLDYCDGSAEALVSGGMAPYSYEWTTIPVQNNSIATDLCTGNYSLTVIDANQCTINESTVISTNTIIKASFIPSPAYATVPVNIYFTYTGTLANSFHWDFGDGYTSTEINPGHYYTRDSLYDVRLIVNSGYPDFCTDTYIYQLKISPISSLYVPSAFTPNDDGINDVFRVATYAIKKINVKIYDRWGQLLCEYNNLDGYWDGYVNGILAKDGVYVYNISAVGYDDVDYRKIGKVTLYCR